MIDINPFLDLTRLTDTDNESDIQALCDQAQSLGVAAVCVYPKFIATAKRLLKDSTIKIATVSNFPSGHSLDCSNEIKQAIDDGADEIDWVLPYQKFLAGEDISQALKQVRQTCGNKILKVIIESGAYPNAVLIEQAAKLVIDAGADFVKTSTGKIDKGASIEAAQAILTAIKNSGKKNIGVKLSGGIRTAEQVQQYSDLIQQMMGNEWITAQHLRFGCSRPPLRP